MKTNIKLTMEDRVIDSAKAHARKKGESLSLIVENYLKSITAREETNLTISDKVRRMMGVISLPEDFDYKKTLHSKI